ncbi:uncharacterized protein [Ptychodera flava]|uniref:uncharacterized protein n=1 Tax=Ptychodera flava TaxID=63121 RepID=UPI00396A9D79
MTNFVTRSLINVPYLRELTLAHPVSDATSFEISVLIGADYYWDFVEDRVIRGSGPTAVSSKFGYLLSGPIHSGKATKNPATILHILTDTCEEESQLKVYWDLETIGIKDELLANNKTKDDFELYRDTHTLKMAKRDHKLEPDTTVNALGLRWLTETDELTYAKKDLKPVDSLTTKREVVRTTASLYDPLGYLSPVHVKAKVFIQQLWKKGLAWDEPLGNEMCKQWTDIANDISKTTELKFKRQYFDSPIQPDSQDYDLHVFAGASKKAYGAVAYLRHGNETAIVMAKTRVAPLKELTLPQLELMAALENPADLLTRGISARNLETNKLWWNGPSWLHHGDWPISELFDSAIHHVSLSAARDDDLLGNSDQTGDNKIVSEPEREMPATGIQFIVDANRYSNLPKLLRVSALVIRFVSNLKKSAVRKRGPITADEIQHAELVWIKHIQQETYGRRSVQQKGQFATTQKQLKLFADESGILRCDGRLQNVPIGYDVKFPILLPNNHRFTDHLILDAHSRLLHAGVQSTVTNTDSFQSDSNPQHTASVA